MPRKGLAASARRARKRTESRADSASSSESGPGSQSGSESESDSGPPTAGPRTGPMPVRRLQCPGCGKTFPSVSLLRRHRNSHRLAYPDCREASRREKWPRLLAQGRAAGAEWDSDEMQDQLEVMLGGGPNVDLPPGHGAVPNSIMQPRDRVSDARARRRRRS
jgi:hypothetical protein